MAKRKEDYPLILNVSDIMEVLGVGRRVAYVLMDQTDFPTIRIGRLKKVNRETFFEWVDKQGKIS